MVKKDIDFKESISAKISVQDFSEMEKFKLTDEEIRSAYPTRTIKDDEIEVLKEKLVEFTKIVYSININNNNN